MFFKGLIGFIVWALANTVYLDMKKKGRRGFTRFCAFWAGTPTTWLMLIFVREGRKPELPVPPDDAEALLSEIRRDRALAGGSTEPIEGEIP